MDRCPSSCHGVVVSELRVIAWAVAVVVVSGCTASESPMTPSTSSLTISNLTLADRGLETDGCSGLRTDGTIDEVDFLFQNPGRRDLTQFGIEYVGRTPFLGQLRMCTPARCNAANYGHDACIIEGTTTSESGRIRMFN